MKEGWTYKKLGEVCNIDYGTRVVRSRDGGTIYPVYGGGGATFKMDSYNREDCMVISRFAMSEQCTRFVKGKFFLNDSGLTLSLKNKELNQEFLNWNILSLNNTIYSLGRGTAQKNLDTKAFAEITISYPVELSEQKAIVSRLDSAFAHIDALKANAKKQLDDAKALFQKALEEAMEPKEGWEEKKLGDIGETLTGTTPSKSEKENYGDYMPFIRPTEVNADGLGGLRYDSEMKLSKEGALKGRILKPYSIFMVCIGATISKVGYSEREVSCNQQINILTPRNGYHYKFLYYSMTNEPFKKLVVKEGTSAQATLPIISKGKWEKLKIYVPSSIEEQQAIVAQLDQLSEKVKRLQEIQEKTIKECDALKQAILREVFE